MKNIICIGLSAVFATYAAAPCHAAMAKSLDYELEYSSVNAGSDDTSSAAYNIVGIITTDGISGESISSAGGVYTIEPLVGSSTLPLTSVSDWSIY